MTKNAQQKKHGAEQKQIDREMTGQAPVFRGMTEATAGDVEATDFCHDGGDDERSPKKSRRDLRLSRPNAYHDQTNWPRLS